jgi:hypothetical protein
LGWQAGSSHTQQPLHEANHSMRQPTARLLLGWGRSRLLPLLLLGRGLLLLLLLLLNLHACNSSKEGVAGT